MFRSRVVDVLTGFGGLAFCAALLLLQDVSRIALEYALIVVPVVVFPALTWLRVRGRRSPWFTFFAVNVWFVVAQALLAKIALTTIAALWIPLVLGIVASLLITLGSQALQVLTILVAAIGAIFAAPVVWSSMLSSSVSIPAPDVSLTRLDGGHVSLADLHGKVVVLNFWGVWCGPCAAEMPELADFARQSGTNVFAVNSRDKPDEIVRFLHAHKLDLPVALDSSHSAYDSFGIRALPTTVIIDPSGVVRERRVGFAATAHYAAWLSRETTRLSRGEPR